MAEGLCHSAVRGSKTGELSEKTGQVGMAGARQAVPPCGAITVVLGESSLLSRRGLYSLGVCVIIACIKHLDVGMRTC